MSEKPKYICSQDEADGFKFCTTAEEVENLSPEEYELHMRMLMRKFLKDKHSN